MEEMLPVPVRGAHAPRTARRTPGLPLISFNRKDQKPVSDANMNELNVDSKVDGEKRSFDPFAVRGVFQGLAEQSAARARENLEKMKAASGEISDLLKQAYSTNAQGTADYAAKVIEISSANTSSAFDFLTEFVGTKSLSEAIQLSAAHGRKSFEVNTAHNKELWELARKVATETAEPIKKGFAKALKTTP
jgi:phasin